MASKKTVAKASTQRPAAVRPLKSLASRTRSDRAAAVAIDTSDKAMVALLRQLKAAKTKGEVRELTEQLERVIFHKQFANA